MGENQDKSQSTHPQVRTGAGGVMADNPKFWIDVVRTNAHTTDCAAKTQLLTNAADALTRVFDDIEVDRKNTANCIGTLLGEKRVLKDELTTLRAEVGRLRGAAASTKSRAIEMVGWYRNEYNAKTIDMILEELRNNLEPTK
jgi:hypothetical protein